MREANPERELAGLGIYIRSKKEAALHHTFH